MDDKALLDLAQLSKILPTGSPLTVGVSGGADSMALLHALRAADLYRLSVVHINHGLRGGESNGEEELVRRVASQMDLPFVAFRIPPGAFDRLKDTTLEEALRRERHRLLGEAVSLTSGCRTVAIGHNADDLIETFLMQLMRGTGAAGLTFRFATEHGEVLHVRPLWKTHRTEIETYCAFHGIPYAHDSSNADTRFTRNRVRHVLLPLMEREFNPQVRKNLFASAVCISDLCCGGVQSQTQSEADGIECESSCELSVTPLLSRPDHERIHEIYRWLSVNMGSVPTRKHIESAVGLMLTPGETCASVRLSPDAQLAHHGNALCVVPVCSGAETTPEEQATRWLAARSCRQNPRLFAAHLPVPVPVVFENGQCAVTLTDLCGRLCTLRLTQIVPAGRHVAVPAELFLRNRNHADRVAGSSVRIKQLLCNDKVPPYLRDYLVVLADGQGQVFAMIQMPRIQKRLFLAGGITYHWDIEVPDQENYDRR